MDTNTYTILEEKREEMEKKLKRLQKKAQKYDIPFSYSEGEPYAIEIKHRDDYGATYTNKYEVFDLTIESEVIRKDGYTVLAHIEHADNGNIVNSFNCDVDKEWVTMAPFCEHCNANHNLKYTFIVANGAERKQVGRNCLKDYCGIDPQVIGMFNQFEEEIYDDTPERLDFEGISCVYDCIEVLAHSIAITKEQGYIKSDERNSNKGKLLKIHYDSTVPYEEAEQMAKGILALSLDDAIDSYLNNVQARLKGGYCKPSDFGYFAYAPTAYVKLMEKKARETQRNAEKQEIASKSEYVGNVSDRATFSIKEMRLLTSFATEYGYTYLYRFIDNNDNVLVWFASSPWEDTNVKTIKATIKAHNEREGVKQTVLTRVKKVA